MRLLIKSGYVIDPANEIEGRNDVYVVNGKIAKVAESIDEPAERVIEATGKYVLPGFIDMHVHFREPGFEYKETIKTGSLSAAAGGFTSVCTMPNTKPAIDTPERVREIIDKAKKDSVVNIYPIAAITLGQEGKELADIKGMVEAGAVALSEDGKSVMNSGLYAKAMKEAAELGVLICAHCEDKDLVRGGVMNAGAKAEELGLPGITNAVEDIITARDLLLAEETGVKLHLCHCSTLKSTEMLKKAKEEGADVTAETCPHYFTLTDNDIPDDDGNFKMNPPVRSGEDKEALIKALKDNVIDVIATDHAPHSEEEKNVSMLKAPFGIVGLETAFALGFTELVKKGVLTLGALVEKMSLMPAKRLGIDKGTLGVGKDADLVIVDLSEEVVVNPEEFKSKGRNTPFTGRRLSGKVLYTVVAGKVVYNAAEGVK